MFSPIHIKHIVLCLVLFLTAAKGVGQNNIPKFIYSDGHSKEITNVIPNSSGMIYCSQDVANKLIFWDFQSSCSFYSLTVEKGIRDLQWENDTLLKVLNGNNELIEIEPLNQYNHKVGAIEGSRDAKFYKKGFLCFNDELYYLDEEGNKSAFKEENNKEIKFQDFEEISIINTNQLILTGPKKNLILVLDGDKFVLKSKIKDGLKEHTSSVGVNLFITSDGFLGRIDSNGSFHALSDVLSPVSMKNQFVSVVRVGNGALVLQEDGGIYSLLSEKMKIKRSNLPSDKAYTALLSIENSDSFIVISRNSFMVFQLGRNWPVKSFDGAGHSILCHQIFNESVIVGTLEGGIQIIPFNGFLSHESSPMYISFYERKGNWNVIPINISVKDEKSFVVQAIRYKFHEGSKSLSKLIYENHEFDVQSKQLTRIVEREVKYKKKDVFTFENLLQGIEKNSEQNIDNGFSSELIDNRKLLIRHDGNELMSIYPTKGQPIFENGQWYFTDKDNLESFVFLYGGKIIPSVQLDMFFNNPSKVFTPACGLKKDFLVKLDLAYNKRLKMAKVNSPLELIKDLIPIDVEIIESSDDNAKLKISWEDSSLEFDRLHVKVNDIPIYGTSGKKLSNTKGKKQLVEEFSLENGLNHAEVYLETINGIYSIVIPVQLFGSSKSEKKKMYVVSIGVSNYLDEKYNLKYASKDARDIMNELTDNSKYYSEVDSLLIVNAHFTKSSLEMIGGFISSASLEDLVIVYFAGHGVLDSEFSYFLATTEMDFLNPTEKGVSYKSLTDVLGKCKSRHKLLIVDACHSGELDVEEVAVSMQEVEEEGAVQFRTINSSINYSYLNSENIFNLSRSLFYDSRLDNGLNVISASSGVEFAMESEEWSNGLFTYAFLSALRSNKTDADNNGRINLNELLNVTRKEVYKLSGGKQHPELREYNKYSNPIIN